MGEIERILQSLDRDQWWYWMGWATADPTRVASWEVSFDQRHLFWVDSPSGKWAERLVKNGRGWSVLYYLWGLTMQDEVNPPFWDISTDLNVYQEEQSKGCYDYNHLNDKRRKEKG